MMDWQPDREKDRHTDRQTDSKWKDIWKCAIDCPLGWLVTLLCATACDSGDLLAQFRHWFWQVVEKLSRKEKQELVGSPVPINPYTPFICVWPSRFISGRQVQRCRQVRKVSSPFLLSPYDLPMIIISLQPTRAFLVSMFHCTRPDVYWERNLELPSKRRDLVSCDANIIG